MAGFFFQPRRHQKGEEIAVLVLFPAYVTQFMRIVAQINKDSSAGVVSCLCNGRSLPMKLLFPAHETGVPCQWNSCANKM